MKHVILIFCCIFFSCAQTKTEGITILSSIEFKEKINDSEVQLLDVRTPSEWKEGVINDPIKINFLERSILKKKLCNLTKKNQ